MIHQPFTLHQPSFHSKTRIISALCCRIVGWCHGHARLVVIVLVTMSVSLFSIGVRNLNVNANLDHLFSADEPWRILEAEFNNTFPQFTNLLILVVDGVTSEVAEQAVQRLTGRLAEHESLFEFVHVVGDESFFRRHGLLFLSLEELTSIVDHLIEVQPFLGILSTDPSLRGLFQIVTLMLEEGERGNLDVAQITQPIGEIAQALNAELNQEHHPLSWKKLLTNHDPELHGLRRLIFIKPRLDFRQLAPSTQAMHMIRTTITELDLIPERGVRVRMTGKAAIESEELSTIVENIWVSIGLSITLVTMILIFGLRSWRLIVPILISLGTGLILTTAFATLTVGSLNPLSIAFTVLFIGIGVDFGIQFTTCYRVLHHKQDDSAWALRATAVTIGPSLLLASVILSVGFLAFVPTSYLGVVQLGLIAGIGMIIAVLLNLTLLPSLISLFNPRGEPEDIRYHWAAALDHVLVDRCRVILGMTFLVTLGATIYASNIRFDFNALNLRAIESESISTAFDLLEIPEITLFNINILTESLVEAQTLTSRLENLPEVEAVFSIHTLIPQQQDEKLEIIEEGGIFLLPSLYLPRTPAPTAVEIRHQITQTIDQLNRFSEKAEFLYLATQLERVLNQDDQTVMTLMNSALAIESLVQQLDTLRDVLTPDYVTLDTIPPSIQRDWITPEGRVRLFVAPAGNQLDNDDLTRFATAVRAVAPNATGTAVTMQEAAKTIIHAFLVAGIIAFCVITTILSVVFRRLIDVILVLLPLVVSGVLTLATCVMINLPINFANIIALPLQIGIGVAFNIYFIMYWRCGFAYPLQSSIARATLFSALTTLVAFSSLAISPHPGTASMGMLLFISLSYTLLTTWFVLPAMMGAAKDNRK